MTTFYTEEPDECVECGDYEKMGLYQVSVDGVDGYWAWICDECGEAHLCAEPKIAPFSSLFVEEPLVDRSEVTKGALKSAVFAVCREQAADQEGPAESDPIPDIYPEDDFDFNYQDAVKEDAEDDPDPEDRT